MSSWLEASHLRVDVGGAPEVDGLTLSASGAHVLVLGAPRALFEAAAGVRPTARGSLLVANLPPLDAVRAGRAASASLDPPLPPAWTAFDYARWSARLAGHPRRTAAAMAATALESMGVAPSGRTKLRSATLGLRRATVIAGALATGAATLLVEDPTSGLDDATARSLARSTAAALEDRRSVVFSARLPLESPLALAADEALVLDRARVVAQGAPAEIAAAARTIAVRVAGDVDAFVRAVEAGGAEACTLESAAALPAVLRVELGSLAARDLFRIAAGSGAVLLELRPVALPFA